MGRDLPAQVFFEKRAPEFARITESIESICGLPASFREGESDVKVPSHRLQGRLAFPCAPEEEVELLSLHPCRMRRPYVESLGRRGEKPPLAQPVEGLDESEEHEEMWIDFKRHQDPTLYYVTLLALESIGGRVIEPINAAQRARYSAPLSAGTLIKRRRRARFKSRLGSAVGFLLLPVIVPLLLLYLLYGACWIPSELYRAYKQVRPRAADGGGL